MNLSVEYVLALLIAIFVEGAIYWILIKRKLVSFAYSALINSFTFPIATYSYSNMLNNYLAIEIFVVLVESILIMLLFRTRYEKAFFTSLIANTITASIGLLFLWK